MRRFALVLVFTILTVQVVCASAQAAVQWISKPASELGAPWNLIALPAIPKDPNPDVVFAGHSSLDGNIYRWEAPTQSIIQYSSWDPEAFRGVLLGDGYWLWEPGTLQSPNPAPIGYWGITDNDTVDMWISLPGMQNDAGGGGWTLIGCPYDHEILWDNVKVTDGTVTVSMAEASDPAQKGWLGQAHYYWDSASQSMARMGPSSTWPDSDRLMPWHGYWIDSKVDNLALIIETVP